MNCGVLASWGLTGREGMRDNEGRTEDTSAITGGADTTRVQLRKSEWKITKKWKLSMFYSFYFS